ncbi:MAG: homocitrate synthase [Actinomycetota bacterium]|nr:homocitrate synthase [Actinomycetota bacterium]
MPSGSALGKNKIKFDDTTLRDGEQTAGVVFANQEKIRIAKLLDEIGVDQIEAGIPTMGGDERDTIEKIAHLGLKASILGWNRANTADIKTSIDCGVDAVAISLATSDIHIETKLMKDRAWVLDSIRKAVAYAKSEGVYVSVNAEDASRTEMGFLVEYAKAAAQEGADRIRFCDTIGVMDPFSTYSAINNLIEHTGLEVEMHTHNDFGMAVSNALAGIHAGATWVNVTVAGLGERAGNAALEEVVMALKYVHDQDIEMDTTRFREIAEYVMKAAGRKIPIWKSVIGSNMFAHESGIHADGVIKNPKTYEVFSPDEVGLQRQIVIGKHSGTKAIELKFHEYGLDLTHEEAMEMLPMVRTMSIELKRSLFDKELLYVYNDFKKAKKNKRIAI